MHLPQDEFLTGEFLWFVTGWYMFRFITERSLLIEHRTNWTEQLVMHTIHACIELETDAVVSKESLLFRAPELCNTHRFVTQCIRRLDF